MAKRFLDTGFLDQKWIRKLSPEKKIFLIYLMLKCDNGGIIDLDFDDVSFWIGKKIDSVDFLPKDYLILIDGLSKYFMPKFIEWQYPNFPHSKMHQQVQAKQLLIKHGIFDIENQSIVLPNNYVKVIQSLGKSYLIGNDNGNGNGNGNEEETERKQKKSEGKKKFIIPLISDVINYFKENGYTEQSAIKAFNHYELGEWHDTNGKPVLNWKQKVHTIWFKPENLIVQSLEKEGKDNHVTFEDIEKYKKKFRGK